MLNFSKAFFFTEHALSCMLRVMLQIKRFNLKTKEFKYSLRELLRLVTVNRIFSDIKSQLVPGWLNT
jgi:hypothetical protein